MFVKRFFAGGDGIWVRFKTIKEQPTNHNELLSYVNTPERKSSTVSTVEPYYYDCIRRHSHAIVVYHTMKQKSIGGSAAMKNQFQALQGYLSKEKPSSFSFMSENQDWYDVANPLKLELTFENMLISSNPGMIFLRGEHGSMCIDHVKSVKYIKDKSILGTIIVVMCEQSGTRCGEVTYTLIAA